MMAINSAHDVEDLMEMNKGVFISSAVNLVSQIIQHPEPESWLGEMTKQAIH